MKPGDLIADRFEIERLASSGGMGAVYRALDRETQQPIALKVLLHQGIGLPRFEREAEVLARLNHPHVVKYIAHGVADGAAWLAIEWLDGQDLASRLEAGPLSIPESLALARTVAEALGTAHEAGVVHRDIKPSNLFLEGKDLTRVKILDFGVARLESSSGAQTRTGTALGTPAYMAPEQARGARDVDARADVFALGCVLFECIAGRAVFVADNVMAILAKVLLEEVPRLGELVPVSAALDDLVSRMLSKAPEGRPPNAAKIAEALDAILKAGDAPPSEQAAPQSLTAGEQKLFSIVLAQTSSSSPLEGSGLAVLSEDQMEAALAETVVPDEALAVLIRIRLELSGFGAHVERLADGTIVATLSSGAGTATDQAVRAARFALAVRAMMPDIPMALATGRGRVVTERWPVGEVIDRAARLLRRDAARATKAAEGTARAAAGGLGARPMTFGAPPSVKGAPSGISLGGGMRLGASAPRPVRVDDVTAGLLDVRFDVGGDAHGLELRGEREQMEATRTLLGKPTPFVGRERELRVLLGSFDECAGEPVARAVLVTGGPGVGKSRLRYEFVRALRERSGEEASSSREPRSRPPPADEEASSIRSLARPPSDDAAPSREVRSRPTPGRVEVWTGRGDPMSAGAPYAMIAPAIRRAAGIYDGEPLAVRRLKLSARIGRALAGEELARVAAFIGELVGAPVPEEEESVQLRAARQDPVLMSDQVRRAFEAWLDAETRSGPLVLVLEDLHWGDAPSVELVEAALRSPEGRPFFVLALARPEVRDVFPRLWEDRAVNELRLADITRKAAEKLVRAVIPYASTSLVERVVLQASGNAFYLEELIRAASSGKGGSLPETVLAMVEARLESLSADTRRVLRAGSVFGQMLWRGGVAALVGGEEKKELLAKLDELVDVEVLARRSETRFPGQTEYVFRQSLVREAAYQMLTEQDRILGHKLAAEWLAATGETEAVVLADHLERGGEATRAAELYLRAAREARDANDLSAAVARAERGVMCGAEGELLGYLRLVQAEAHRWLDENVECARAAEEALELLPTRSTGWFSALIEFAHALSKTIPAKLTTFAESLRGERVAAKEHDEIRMLAHVATRLTLIGQHELASALLDRLPDDGVAADPTVLAQVHTARGSRRMYFGDTSAYIRHLEAAAAIYEESGDRRNIALVRANLGGGYADVGLFEEGVRELRAARDAAIALKLRVVELAAASNLAYALAYKGEIDESRSLSASVAAATAKTGSTRVGGFARLFYALASLVAGDYGLALPAARAAVEETAEFPPLHAYALGILARAKLAQLDRAAALADAARAMQILEELGGLDSGDALVRLTYAEALYASGDFSRAKVIIAAAKRRLLERERLIADPAMRLAFMTRVPEHAATTARYREWLGDDPEG